MLETLATLTDTRLRGADLRRWPRAGAGTAASPSTLRPDAEFAPALADLVPAIPRRTRRRDDNALSGVYPARWWATGCAEW